MYKLTITSKQGEILLVETAGEELVLKARAVRWAKEYYGGLAEEVFADALGDSYSVEAAYAFMQRIIAAVGGRAPGVTIGPVDG